MSRPNWEQYFLSLAAVVATRSSCTRASVGCVVVDADRRIVSTGYNGAIPGARHCDHSQIEAEVHEEGWWQRVDVDEYGDKHYIQTSTGHHGDMEDGHCSNALHAEMNAIAHAASAGVSLKGATAYVTHAPCRPCYQMMRAAGIELIVYRTAYRLHPLVAESVHVRKEEQR